MKFKNKRNLKRRIHIVLTLFVFFTSLLSTLMVMAIFMLLNHANVLVFGRIAPLIYLLLLFVPSIIIATTLSAFFSKMPLRPIGSLTDAIEEIANGNFNVRLNSRDFGGGGKLADSFNKMAKELSSIETLRKDFINDFSHEFKTPIVSIRGYAKLLKNNNLNEKEREEYLNIIIDESERLSRLAVNTLFMSKLESQNIDGGKNEFFLDEQLRQCVLLLENLWTKKNIELDIEFEPVKITANEQTLRQVWINLLDNAVKFTGENGKISLSLQKSGDMAIVTVSDNGIGMDGDTLSRAFDKFYQGDASRSAEGNGLGLPVVKQILLLSGGSIKIKSDGVGKGTTFIIVLPIQSTGTDVK